MLGVLYTISILIVILSLVMHRSYKVKQPQLHSYSIVIACRNEEEQLPLHLASLAALDYPKERHEILIVDDASTDNSYSLLKAFCSQHSNAHCFRLTEKDPAYPGKRAALKLAISHAKNDFLLYTDADTLVPTNWLKGYDTQITEQTGIVIGYVRGVKLNGFEHFLRTVRVGVFAATATAGLPFTCSGGNFLLRRSVYLEVGGYDSMKLFGSGDDKMMLNLVKKTSYSITYQALPKVFEQQKKHALHDFFQRERRHMGKLAISSPFYQFTFVVIILLLYVGLPYALFAWNAWHGILAFYLACCFFYLSSCLKHHEQPQWYDFILIAICPYYLTFMTIWGSGKQVVWKN